MALRRSIPLLLVPCVLLSLWVKGSSVSAEPIDPNAQYVAGHLMSPYCPGRLLADCPSGKADELKQRIRTEISSGRDKEELLEALIKEYGEAYRAMPKNEGFGRFVWITPLAFLLVGAAFISAWLSRRRSHSSVSSPPVKAPRDSSLDERIRRELDES